MGNFKDKVAKSRKPIPFKVGNEIWYVADVPAVQAKSYMVPFTTDRDFDAPEFNEDEYNIEMKEAGLALLKNFLVDDKGKKYEDLQELTSEELDEHLSAKQAKEIVLAIVKAMSGADVLGN